VQIIEDDGEDGDTGADLGGRGNSGGGCGDNGKDNQKLTSAVEASLALGTFVASTSNFGAHSTRAVGEHG